MKDTVRALAKPAVGIMAFARFARDSIGFALIVRSCGWPIGFFGRNLGGGLIPWRAGSMPLTPTGSFVIQKTIFLNHFPFSPDGASVVGYRGMVDAP